MASSGGFDSSMLDRLVGAIKGTSRLSNPMARVFDSRASMRDLSAEQVISFVFASTAIGTNGVVSVTDPLGNEYAMLDVAGFADGATLY